VGAWIEIDFNPDQYEHSALSLPAWERGLKLITLKMNLLILLSLPAWERGLKFLENTLSLNTNSSLPAWERGLKSKYHQTYPGAEHVAPCVGAWIEITSSTNPR